MDHTEYASQWPAFGQTAGRNVVPRVGQASVGTWRRNTDKGMLRVREGVRGAVLEHWLPFTWAILSRFLGPRAPVAPFESPYDFPGERILRFGDNPSADRAFPYPYEIGAVSGLMPLLDQYSMQWAWGKTPSGPGVLTPIPIPWQASYPNLQKVTG